MRRYYMNSWAKIVEFMGTSIHKGLFEYDCIIRREESGDNSISLPSGYNRKEILLNTLNKYNIGLSVIIFTILLINKSYLLLGIWAFFVIINNTIKYYMYFSKNNKLNNIQKLNDTDVIVLREGVERIVKCHELVKGDMVIFKKNSFIAADIRIISSKDLLVDERNITGNTLLKKKNEHKLFKEPSSINEIENMLFKGTVIKEGYGTGVVVEIGNNTMLGKLYCSINNNISKKDLCEIAENQIIKIQYILFIFSILLYILVPGKDSIKNQVFTSSIFIISTFSISIACWLYYKKTIKEFEKKNIFINDISASKNSSDTKVLFFDKMGSITEEELVVNKFFTNEKYFEKESLDINEINIKRLLDIAIINSDIYINEKTLADDMYSNAYGELIKEKNINKLQIVRNNHLKFRVPFESDKKIMTTVVKTIRGYRANTRGSLEVLLSRCTYILVNGVERPITQGDFEKAKLAELYFSRDGLITEACAYRNFNYEPTIEENVESNLVFVGLIAHINTLVSNGKNDIEELFDEGVLPIMICDDNKIFAEILGRRIGLISSENEVTSGIELSYLSQDEFYKVVSKTRVYCKLTPKQKEVIISTYIKDGFKVAVEGKNLGDLSSITSCNLGISKYKSPLLLKNASDIYTKESTIKTLLKLRSHSNREDNILDSISYAYIKMLMAIVTVMFSFYLFENNILFTVSTLVILIAFTIMPTIIVSMLGGCRRIKRKWLNILATFVVSILSVYFVKECKEFTIYIIISLVSLIDIVVTTDINIRKFSKETAILILTIVWMIVGCIITFYLTNSIITIFLVLIIIACILSYLILILISEKWQ